MAIKVLIADDDSLIRESLKIILEVDEQIEVVCCVENGQEAVDGCSNNDIDVALLDVRMPIMNGVEATKEIVYKYDTKVLILTTFDEDEYISQSIKNGAKGYLLKNNSPSKIIDAIKTINGGNSVIQEDVLDKIRFQLDDNSINKNPDEKIDISIFTERELEVVKAIAEGLTNKEIASQLFISEGTVKNYITSILNKTKLKHRTQIAIYYLKGM